MSAMRKKTILEQLEERKKGSTDTSAYTEAPRKNIPTANEPIKNQVNSLYKSSNTSNTSSIWDRVKSRAENLLNNQNVKNISEFGINLLSKGNYDIGKNVINSKDNYLKEIGNTTQNTLKAIKNIDYTEQKFASGIIQGGTGIVQAKLTELANNLKKGNEKGTAKAIEDIVSNFPSIGNPLNIIQNPNNLKNLLTSTVEKVTKLNNSEKNLLEKEVSLVTGMVSDGINMLPVKKQIDDVTQLAGSVLPVNSSENVLKVNEQISKPSEKINEMLLNESKNYGKVTNTVADAIQSIGNMTPSIGVSAITGNPSLGLMTMGISAKGQATQEALKKGADLQQALDIGNTKGAIEIGTEMLTGGVNIFGKGALDEIVEKGLIGKIENNVLKAIAQYGVDITGEITEETISDILGTVIDKGTVDPEANYSLNDWSDTAKITMLTTTILNILTGGMAVGNNVQQNDNISNNKQEILDNQKYEQKQQTTIENNQFSNNNQQVNQEQSKMSQSETSQELSDTIQNIEELGYTKSENLENYQKTAQKHNINLKDDTVKSIYEVANRRNIKVTYDDSIFTSEKQNAVWNIYEDGTREVVINPKANTETALQSVTIHELTHDMEGTKEYEALSKTVLEKMKTQEGYSEAIQNLTDTYSKVYDKNSSKFNTLIEQEAVADFLGENLGNQEFLNELVQSQPRNTVQKIYDWILDKLNKLTGHSREKIYWKDVKTKFENAFNSEYSNQNPYQHRKHSIGGKIAKDNLVSSNGTNINLEKMYNQALKLAEQKVDNEKIRQQTHWFQDKNGDWKFEFSDKDMALKTFLKENSDYKLGDILKHDVLFELYPDLKNYNIKTKQLPNSKGINDSKKKTIYINNKLLSSNKNVEQTLIHEIQHAIQNIENFEGGRSTQKSKLAYYNSLGEIESTDVSNRFIEEKYNNKDITNIPPESSKKKPRHEKMNSYLQNRGLIDKLKDKAYNSLKDFFDKESRNYNEDFKENKRKNSSSMARMEVWRGHLVDNIPNRGLENSSSFSIQENNTEWQEFLEKHSINKGTKTTIQDVKLPQNPNKGLPKVEKYSITQEQIKKDVENFAKQVDNAINGTFPKRDMLKLLSNTPQALQDIGLPNLPITMTQKHLDTIMNKSGKHTRANYHDLGIDIVKQLPEAINNPLDIIKSNTKDDSIVLTTYLADKQDRTVIASIKIDGTGKINNVEIDSNVMTSAYGRNDYESFMKKNLENGNLLYDIDQGVIKKIDTTRSGLQLPRTSNIDVDTVDDVSTTNNIISQNEKNMQVQKENNYDVSSINKNSIITETGNPVIDNKSNEYKKIDDNIQTMMPMSKEQREKYYNHLGNDINKIKDNYSKLQKRKENLERAFDLELTSSEDWINMSDEINQIEEEQSIVRAKIDEIENIPDTINNIVRQRTYEKKTKEERKLEFQKAWVNEYAEIDNLAQKSKNKKLSIALDNFIGSAQSVEKTINGNIKFGTGQTDINGNLKGESLVERLKPIYKNKNMIEFSDYSQLKLNIERLEQRKPNLSNITKTQCEIKIQKYESKYPYFKEVHNSMETFLANELQNAVDAGLGTQEMFDTVRKMYPSYIPIFKNITELRNLFDNGEITTKMIKKAIGGETEILAVDVACTEYALGMRKKIALNNVLIELKNSLEQQKQLENYINTETTNTYDDFSNTLETKGNESLMEDIDGNKIATCYIDGIAHQFKIPDNYYNLLKNKDIKETTFGQELIAGANNIFRKMVTTYNPAFTIRNAVKDFQSGLYNTKYTAPVYLKNYTRTIKQILTNGKYYQKYKNVGMQGNTIYSKKNGLLIKENTPIIKKVISMPTNSFEFINTQIESAARLSEFISSLEAGNDIDTAKYDSSEVTLNFKRGGTTSKAITRYGATFFNSSVLAIEKTIKNVTGKNGAKGMANFIVNGLISGVGLSLLNHLIYKDDEDYEELQDYIKDGYFLIKKNDGSGNFYRISKEQLNTAIGSTARRIYQMASGENDIDELEDMFKTIFDNIGVNNPITNNIYAPVGQAIFNKSWYDGDIVSESQQELSPEAQYDYRTNELSKTVANGIAHMPEAVKETMKGLPAVSIAYDILSSPKKSNYVAEQYLGGIGKILMPMATPYAEQNYIEKEMTTNSVLKSKYPGKVYDLLDEISKEYTTYGTKEEEYNYLKEATGTMSGYYKEIRELENDKNISNTRKKEKELEIRKELNKYSKEVLNNIEKTKKNKNITKIGENEYYKDTEGKTKKVDEEKSENLSSQTYADYKNKVSVATDKKQRETGKEKAKLNQSESISILQNSTYTDKEKDIIYQEYINTDDEIYTNLKLLNNNDISKINEYLNYKTADLKADKEDDGTKDGKSISGSAKTKLVNYINNSNFSQAEKLYLYGTKYKLNNTERTQLSNYINSLNITSEEKKNIYLTLSSLNVQEMKDGNIEWK